MTRRRVIVGLVVLALIAAASFSPRGPRPCRATFDQVREGMTLDQVAAIVGGPPGKYSDQYEPFVLTGGRYPRAVYWVAHDATLIVWYDDDLVASSVLVEDSLPDHRSALQRLRDWLGL